MKRHNYFGEIIVDEYSGFRSEHKIKIPYFEQEVMIFLDAGDEEDYEDTTIPPTIDELNEMAETLKCFVNNIDKVIVDIQQTCFKYYLDVYAKYYEKPFEVLFANSKVKETQNGEPHPPLNITTKEKHFEYMTEILETIRIYNNKTIRIPISYALDEEHGLEIKIVDNKVTAVEGIANT